MTTTRRRRIAPPVLLLPPPPLLLLLPPLHVITPAPPLLSLIKQCQQGLQHGEVACAVAAAADSRMPSLTPAFSGAFQNKLFLPWNNFIPTCVLRNPK